MGVDWGIASPLGLKLKSLGAQADDLDFLFQVIKRRVIVSAHRNVVRETDSPGQVRALLAGATCSYRTQKNGARSILFFQHPGDFCDLHLYALQGPGPAMGIQGLTDCTVAIIDYRDMDRLLSRSTLAFAFWRASILEAAIYRERLTHVGRRTALERVAHLLCEQMARREVVGLHTPRLPLSQVDIADAVGLSVVHVNRTIQMLRSLNVLSSSAAIEIVDKKKLAKIADFDGLYLNIPKTTLKWALQIEETPD